MNTSKDRTVSTKMRHVTITLMLIKKCSSLVFQTKHLPQCKGFLGISKHILETYQDMLVVIFITTAIEKSIISDIQKNTCTMSCVECQMST